MATVRLFGYYRITNWFGVPLANSVAIDNTCGMTSPGVDGERELAVETPKPRGRIPADTLPNRLMLARRLAGLSIRDAADLCGLGRGAWTKWENGSRPLDLLEITGIIAEKLDIDLEWLRFGGALVPSRGRPTKRSAVAAERGEATGKADDVSNVAVSLVTLPVSPNGDRGNRRVPAQAVRPSDTRPKVRTDSRRSTPPPSAGRRAAPVW